MSLVFKCDVCSVEVTASAFFLDKPNLPWQWLQMAVAPRAYAAAEVYHCCDKVTCQRTFYERRLYALSGETKR